MNTVNTHAPQVRASTHTTQTPTGEEFHIWAPCPEAPCTRPQKTPGSVLSAVLEEKTRGILRTGQQTPREPSENQTWGADSTDWEELRLQKSSPGRSLPSSRGPPAYTSTIHLHAVEAMDTCLSHIHPTTRSPGLSTPVCLLCRFQGSRSPGAQASHSRATWGAGSTMRLANVPREGLGSSLVLTQQPGHVGQRGIRPGPHALTGARGVGEDM